MTLQIKISQTISCLLIQPNPDSALNSTAGHLLQEDYESFARQAILMTSIHASIPSEFRTASTLARRRGEDLEAATPEDAFQWPLAKENPINLPKVVMKKASDAEKSRQSSLRQLPMTRNDGVIEEDEVSAAKENDPALSPTPIFATSPKRFSLAKRPLSDLPCLIAPKGGEASFLSSVEQNATNIMVIDSMKDATREHSQSVELTLNSTSEKSHGVNVDSRVVSAPESKEAESGRPVKRVCSDEAKENVQAEKRHVDRNIQQAKPVISASMPGNRTISGARMASVLGSLGGGRAGKPRVGLRRL